MKQIIQLLFLSLLIPFHIQTTIPENLPPFSEAARIELEKHKQILEAQNERRKLELDAINKEALTGHASEIILFSAIPIGVLGFAVYYIIDLIKSK